MAMKIDEVRSIAVIGAGNMGHQIALLCALHGYKTTCTDVKPDILQKAEVFADSYLPGRVKKGRLTQEEADQARANLTFISDLKETVKDADYVIEAVLEILDVKRKVFADLDRLAPPHAILATNSSYIVSSRIADVTRRPGQVLNLHFFNPALVMKLVEVVQGPHVADETAQVSLTLCERLDKVGVHLKKEVEGFLLNRILHAIGREALWLLEMGVASFEDIDKAQVYGAGHPMGAFRLMDLTGIDLAYVRSMEKFRETGDPADYPPPSLVERYMRGDYGQKTGKGWYDYTSKTEGKEG
jgi:3-hydroxybutyryl-CoA dehydrogenase